MKKSTNLKKELMPWLVLGYIFTLTILCVFAMIGAVATPDPNTTILWLIGGTVVNILCYSFSLTWGIDIVRANVEEDV